MSSNMKQASFLNQTSMITKVSGFQRCKESLIDSKIKNQDKIKGKQQEFSHQESESKAMKFMIAQKSNTYQDVKRNLEQLRHLNRAFNLDKLKQQLYSVRKSELAFLVKSALLQSLLGYY